MNPPSPVARLIASRLVALVLLLASGAVIVEWFAGGASWWQGMLALLIAMQTLSAVGKVSRYKQWSAKWQAMAEPAGESRLNSHTHVEEAASQNPASKAKAPRSGRLRMVVAMLLALAIPLYVGADTDAASPALACLWLAVCLYLGFRLLRRITRGGGMRHAERTAPQKRETESPFVTCVLNKPSASPSRSDAVRNLPEYSARLLAR